MTSHSRAICSQSQRIVNFLKIMSQTSLNFEGTCDLTDVQPSIYDRKSVTRLFDTINDLLRSPSLVQSLLKGRKAPIWRQRAPTLMILSGTDGLKSVEICSPFLLLTFLQMTYMSISQLSVRSQNASFTRGVYKEHKPALYIRAKNSL